MTAIHTTTLVRDEHSGAYRVEVRSATSELIHATPGQASPEAARALYWDWHYGERGPLTWGMEAHKEISDV